MISHISVLQYKKNTLISRSFGKDMGLFFYTFLHPYVNQLLRGAMLKK